MATTMRSERFALVMIAASFIAVAFLVSLMLQRQVAAQRVQIREQGVGLVRMLARLPAEQIVPKTGNGGLLHAALQVGRSGNLGYGTVIDLNGATLAEITSAGTLVPQVPRAGAADAQFGSRTLESPGDGRRVTEFFGPLIEEGRVTGQVRVGFFEPEPALPGADQMPFIALLALPVFLLVSVIYFLLKREMKPLRDIRQQMHRVAEGDAAFPLKLAMSDDLKSFVEQFSRYMQSAQARLRDMEAERFNSTLNHRILGYRQEKVESVLHALPEAVLVLEASGEVTYASAKLDPVLGVDHQAIIGRNVMELGVSGEPAAFLARCQMHPGHAFRGETINIVPEGQPDRHYVASAYPLISVRDAQEPIGVLVVFRDATQEHLARRAGAEFVSHVSHELKSPLNVMRMYSEMLLDAPKDSLQEQVEAVNVIHDEAGRMSRLIENLLSIARLETGTVAIDRQRVRLRDVLEELFAGAEKSAAGKNVMLALDLPSEMGAVLLDKELFGIAVTNLLSNAIKYNRPGGTVTLSAEETDNDVRITVRDTGIGISPTDQARVFDKFFRSPDTEASTRGGHGLGLYLARQIVELHQGSISVSSKPGAGTEFCMQLRKMSAILQEGVRL